MWLFEPLSLVGGDPWSGAKEREVKRGERDSRKLKFRACVFETKTATAARFLMGSSHRDIQLFCPTSWLCVLHKVSLHLQARVQLLWILVCLAGRGS